NTTSQGLINLGLVNLSLIEIITPILVEIDPPILVVLMVLHRRKTGRSNLVCDNLRSVTGIPLIEISRSGFRNVSLNIVMINIAIDGGTILVRMTTPASYTTLLDRFYRRGSLGLILLIKEQCFDHIFEFGDIGRDSGGGSARTHFSNNGFAS
ncbi:hypothetical protein Tco_0248584, partial [Tanacetum coccineum]